MLRHDFVNTWLLAKDLDAIAAKAGSDDVATLCKVIQANYGYPVDSVLIGPDLDVLGHLNVHEPAARNAADYVAFLRQALVRAGAASAELPSAKAAEPAPRPAGKRQHPPTLRLTAESPTATLLDVFRGRPMGQPSLTFYPIDATAFAGGGELEITVQVGSAEAPGKFELCAVARLGRGEGGGEVMQPVRTIPKLAREQSGKLVHPFAEGARFGLAVMPTPGTATDAVNAFSAVVTVRPR